MPNATKVVNSTFPMKKVPMIDPKPDSFKFS